MNVPAIYVAKYNRFVDNILGRINKILGAKYDPVTVKLSSNPTTSSNKSTRNKTKRRKVGGKKNASRKNGPGGASDSVIIDRYGNNKGPAAESTTSPAAATNKEIYEESLNNVAKTIIIEATDSSGVSVPNDETFVVGGTQVRKERRTKNGTTSGSKTASNNKRTKGKKQSKPSRARATLYGLSSLKRSGDVSVNMMRDHTTIKTKFSLGPLVLKVEKEFGRAAKRELRSATATTAEMSGKLSLRVMHGGAATLHSIRVLQPKQVRVESADDHDRTREFVWRRSSHIAHLVSQKLSSATRSMLRPPPIIPAAAA